MVALYQVHQSHFKEPYKKTTIVKKNNNIYNINGA